VRDTPELIVEAARPRGLKLDRTALQMIGRQSGILARRSSLQARATWWASGGRADSLRRAPTAEGACVRDQGNRLKTAGGASEEEEKSLETRLRDQLLAFPQSTSPHCPEGRRSRQHRRCVAGGTPGQGEGLQEQLAGSPRGGPDHSGRSVRIAQSRFVTGWARALAWRRAPDQPDARPARPARLPGVMPPILVNSAA